MFPIKSNDAYIKENGKRSTIGAELGSGGGGGGGTDLPDYSSADAGKSLIVNSSGNLEWLLIQGLNSFGVYEDILMGAPVFKPSSKANKYNIGVWWGSITSSTARTFVDGDYNLNECFIGDIVPYHEFYNYLTEDVIHGLNMTLLYDGSSTATQTAELADDVTNYDFLVLQSCYDSTGTSGYDSTIIYSDVNISKTYGFYVKDRNSQYSGQISFTDATHITINNARRLKVYAI